MGIMSNKRQCYACSEYGRVQKFSGWCCIAVDKNEKIHCERAARKSNCWCFDWKPKKRFKMTTYHKIGKYLSERYGTGVRLTPYYDEFSDEYVFLKSKDFRLIVESPKLIIPVEIIFTIANKEKRKIYDFFDVCKILKNYEV